MRSSVGVARRSSMILVAYALYSPYASPALMNMSSVALPLWDLSMSSDQRSRSRRSSGATPSMSPIMIIGSMAATSLTRSHSPCSQTESMISSQAWRTLSVSSRTRRGVKPRLTSLRRLQCSGSSMSIIIGSGPLSGRMPPALENVAESFEMAFTSA